MAGAHALSHEISALYIYIYILILIWLFYSQWYFSNYVIASYRPYVFIYLFINKFYLIYRSLFVRFDILGQLGQVYKLK